MQLLFKKATSFLLVSALLLSMLIPGISLAAPIETITVKDMASDGITAQQLAETILGSGVQARKIGGGPLDSTAYKGSSAAAATFSGGLPSIGIKEGIILSTGKAKDVIGPNNSTSKTTEFSLPGDKDLAALINLPISQTFDASVLEFEFKLPNPTANQVIFKFVLASEEYPEYLNFFDVMGLYINQTNVALVPETNPPQPVSVGNINHTKNSKYYKANHSTTDPAFNTQMDGFTTVLTATADIVPNSWNTIKLAIADKGDAAYDSSVFIEAKSLGAPGGLVSSNITGSGFTLNWNAIPNVSAYDVFFVKTDGQNSEEIFVAPAATNSYTFTGLKEFTDYSVVVKSRDSNGVQSPPSPPLTVKTKDITAPSVPSNLTIVDTTANEVQVVWTPSTDSGSGVNKYLMYLNNSEVGQSSATDYTFTSLTESTQYILSVAAMDKDGNISERTNITTKTNDGTPPSSPKISPKPPRIIGKNGATVTWQASVDNPGGAGMDNYRVFLNLPTNTPDEQYQVCATKYLACVVNGLTPNTSYTMKVVAVDLAGNTSIINEDSTVTFTARDGLSTDTTSPSVPGAITVSSRTATGFTVAWGPSVDVKVTGQTTSGLAGYELYLGDEIVNSLDPLARTFNYTGLKPETNYEVKIRSVDLVGNKSAFRTVSTSTTKDLQAPTIPNGLTATNKTDKSFTLTWNESIDNIAMAEYEVYQDGLILDTVENPTIDVKGLTAGKRYRMTVRAVDKVGNKSAASAPLEVQINSDNTPPTRPTGLEVGDVGSAFVELSWDDSSDNVAVTGYEVYSGDNPMPVAIVSDPFVEIKGLTKSTRYFFTVRARDAVNNKSLTSDVLEVKTLDNSEPPLPPDTLFAEAITDENFVLTWESAEDDVGIASYDIYYAVYDDPNPDDDNPGLLLQERTKIKNRAVQANELNSQFLSEIVGSEQGTDVKLTKNMTYHVSIKSVDTDGNESLAFSDVLPVRALNSNNGPRVNLTRIRGDITSTGVNARYEIGRTLVTDDITTTPYLTNANVKCELRNSSGAIVVSLYPRNATPNSGKRLLKVGKNACSLAVGAKTITDGTYFMYLTVEHPTDSSKRTMIVRTVKVDKTAPVISNVGKTNDIYAPDGSLSTTIHFTLNEDSTVAVQVFDANGRTVRILSKKTSLIVNQSNGGNFSFVWDGKDGRKKDVADGRYRVVIRATNKVKLSAVNNLVSNPSAKPPVVGNTLDVYVESKAPSFSKVRASTVAVSRKTGNESVSLSYTLSENAYVSVNVVDVEGTVVRNIQTQTSSDPLKFSKLGVNNFSWNGRDAANKEVVDGRYYLSLSAVDMPPTKEQIKAILNDGTDSEQSLAPKISLPLLVPVDVDGRTDPTFEMTPASGSSLSLEANGTNAVDISYKFNESVRVLTVVRNQSTGAIVRTLENRSARNSNELYNISWNGSLSNGVIVPNGTYKVVVTGTDVSGKTATKEITVNITKTQ